MVRVSLRLHKDAELTLSFRSEEGFDTYPKLRERLSFIPLPASQGAWINTKLVGQLVLTNPQDSTQLDDAFSKAATSIGERRVPKELNDLRHKVKAWRRAFFLPIGHRVRVNAESLCHFPLEEAQVQALLAEMVS